MVNKSRFNQVFVSYAHEDKPAVRKICRELKRNDVNVWWDDDSLKNHGIELDHEIVREIYKSRFVIFCLSRNSKLKIGEDSIGFVDHELNIAFNASLTRKEEMFELLIVKLEEIDLADKRLKEKKYFSVEVGFQECIDSITAHITAGTETFSKAERDWIKFDALMNRSFDCFKKDQTDKAIQYVDEAIAIFPDNYQAWSHKGAILNEVARDEEALKCFTRATDICSVGFEALNNKATLLLKMGRFKEALATADKAISVVDTVHDAWLTKAYGLFALSKYSKALEALNDGLSKCRDEQGKSILWNTKGCFFLDRREVGEAARAFNKALDIDADNEDAQRNLLGLQTSFMHGLNGGFLE